MTQHQHNPGSRNSHTHGRPAPRGTLDTPFIAEPNLYDAYGQFTQQGGEQLWGEADGMRPAKHRWLGAYAAARS